MGRGPFYWLTIGWLWEPAKLLGRVGLWLVAWPLGLWRSIVHGRERRENKARRREVSR